MCALVALVVACALPALAARPAAARPAPVVARPDSSALAWARRVVSLRRQLAEASAAAARQEDEAQALAAAAFAEAQELAEEPGTLHEEGFRVLYLDAQALYEHFFGGVRPPALRGPDLAALRESAVEALAVGGPGFLTLASRPLPDLETAPPAPAIPAHLAVPADAEALVVAEGARLSRAFRGYAGIRRRGRTYFRLIDRELARRELPAELRYVAVIESGLDAGAVSPAGALGLWQMIPATGAMYGLDSTALLDPARATRAAARHLERLGAMFDGDWQLALAAYNWGPARVQSLVARERRRLGRTPTFWDLSRYMPAETRAYVPRFIAVARAFGAPAP